MSPDEYHDVACPVCGAKAKEPCRNPLGALARLHHARTQLGTAKTMEEKS